MEEDGPQGLQWKDLIRLGWLWLRLSYTGDPAPVSLELVTWNGEWG